MDSETGLLSSSVSLILLGSPSNSSRPFRAVAQFFGGLAPGRAQFSSNDLFKPPDLYPEIRTGIH